IAIPPWISAFLPDFRQFLKGFLVSENRITKCSAWQLRSPIKDLGIFFYYRFRDHISPPNSFTDSAVTNVKNTLFFSERIWSSTLSSSDSSVEIALFVNTSMSRKRPELFCKGGGIEGCSTLLTRILNGRSGTANVLWYTN